MFPDDLYVSESMMFQRVEERVSEARSRALVRRLSAGQRGSLSRSIYRLLCQLGRLLVAMGRRVERYALRQLPAPTVGLFMLGEPIGAITAAIRQTLAEAIHAQSRLFLRGNQTIHLADHLHGLGKAAGAFAQGHAGRGVQQVHHVRTLDPAR